MIPKGTVRKRCLRCKKLTLVPNPTPCEERFFLSGIWISRMGEHYEEKTIGVLCFECAFTIEKPFDNASLVLGFCGGKLGDLDNWDALLNRETKK